MKILNIAVWGLGRHAISRIIPALLRIDNILLVGVCSRNIDIVNSCAEELGCIGWNDPNEMLRYQGVDIIYVATPIGLHAVHIKQAFRSGKHVWCEKPLTCKYEDTKSLVSIAKKNNLILTEGFMFLYHPQFKKIQSFVNENINNGIKSIVCRFGIPFLDIPSFRSEVNLCGGAFWDVGSYTICASLALFPKEDVRVIFSEIVHNNNSSVDSEGRALLRFSNQVVVYLEWGIGCSYKNEIEVWGNTCSIYTDKIFSKPEKFQPTFNIRDKSGNISLVEGEKSEQFIDMFSSYYDAFDNSNKIQIEFQNILRRAKVMDQILCFAKVNKKK